MSCEIFYTSHISYNSHTSYNFYNLHNTHTSHLVSPKKTRGVIKKFNHVGLLPDMVETNLVIAKIFILGR